MKIYTDKYNEGHKYLQNALIHVLRKKLIGMNLFDNVLWLAKYIKYSDNGKEITTLAVPLPGGEYLYVTPNDNLGTYCFFQFEDPINIKQQFNNEMNVEQKVSIICFVNAKEGVYNLIYDADEYVKDSSMNTTDFFQSQLLYYLKQPGLFSGTFTGSNQPISEYMFGKLEIEKIYTEPENVFRKIDMRVIDSQYMISPYGAFRAVYNFTGRLRCRNST